MRQSANLSPAQIRAAIPHLEARLAELKALDVESISSRNDPSVLAVQSAIEATLVRIFGAGSNEYSRLFRAKRLDTTRYVGRPGGYTPISEIRQGVERGRQRAIGLLNQEVVLMREQLGDDGSSAADRAIRAYSNLDLHPEIARAASELYRALRQRY